MRRSPSAVALLWLPFLLGGGCATNRDCATLSPLRAYVGAHPSTDESVDATAVAEFALREPGVDGLECWASRGEKYAQFTLGYGYERGIGLPRDLQRARHFYEQAAKPTVANRSFYAAPVGNQRYGTVVTAPVGPSEPGLAEAIEALRRLSKH